MIVVDHGNKRLVTLNEDGTLDKEAVIVLITTDGGLVSIDTDPNVCIVDNIFVIFVLMLYLKLNCCRHSDIIAVKEYASDLQSFLGSKVIEEEVLKEQEFVMALSDDECLQQFNLDF
jgi:hypothetical protein